MEVTSLSYDLISKHLNKTLSSVHLGTLDTPLSKEAKEIAVLVNCIVICGSVATFGIINNVFNIFVFSKQGYYNTMNISLTGIAVADICTLISIIWFDVCISPHLENSGTNVAFSEVLYLTAGWPNCIFARITCIITVFITIERCLCVVTPLKVKDFITKTKTVIVIFFIFISQMTTTIPTYYSTYIDWKFFPAKNRSLLGLYRISNWEETETISFVLQAIMQAASFLLLIFFTAILVISLRRKSKWRTSSSSASQKTTFTMRDRKLVRMVTLIAVILILCFTPGMICFTAMAFEPGFIVGGVHDNLFFVIGSFTFICQTINSSVNIFIYYNMSSNYRDTFNELFPRLAQLLMINKNTIENT